MHAFGYMCIHQTKTLSERTAGLMTVIDAQVHVWGRDTPDRPWLPDGAQGAKAHADKGILLKGRSQEFTAAELIAAMDEAGVDAAVLVPPNFEGDRNDQVLAAARDYAPRFAVMGRVSPNDKDEALPLMRGWKDNLGAFSFRSAPRAERPSTQCGPTARSTGFGARPRALEFH